MSLKNFSVYSIHQQSNSPWKALQLLKPTTVSSTVGVSYKYNPPTSDDISALGLCLHTDMHNVTGSISAEQVSVQGLINSVERKACFKPQDNMSSSIIYQSRDRKWRVQARTSIFCRDWPWNNFFSHSLPTADSSWAVVSYWLTTLKWASSWGFGIYHIGDQRRLRRACTSAHWLGGWAGRWCWVASRAGASCYFCI